MSSSVELKASAFAHASHITAFNHSTLQNSADSASELHQDFSLSS